MGKKDKGRKVGRDEKIKNRKPFCTALPKGTKRAKEKVGGTLGVIRAGHQSRSPEDRRNI